MKRTTWQFGLIVILAAFAGVASAQVSITNPSPLPQAYIGVPYYVQLNATGGTAPYTWEVVITTICCPVKFFGALPSGLSLNTQTGVISGTPTQVPPPGNNYTIKVTDSKAGSDTKIFDLPVSQPALAITTNSPLPAGTVGVA